MGNLSFGEPLCRVNDDKNRVNVCQRVQKLTCCVCVSVILEISELAFRRHFDECGTVEAVRLVRDPNSGLGKGFGYVLFEVRRLISCFFSPCDQGPVTSDLQIIMAR